MIGTPPTIDNIIHSQGSFSYILYKSYIATHVVTRSIAFELCLGRTISSMLKLYKRGGGVTIRMSWSAFFEKNSRGDVYSGLESISNLITLLFPAVVISSQFWSPLYPDLRKALIDVQHLLKFYFSPTQGPASYNYEESLTTLRYFLKFILFKIVFIILGLLTSSEFSSFSSLFVYVLNFHSR